jgi:transposase
MESPKVEVEQNQKTDETNEMDDTDEIHAEHTGNASKTCRYFGISRDTFYRWKRAYAERGEQGLINSKPCPHNPRLCTPAHIEEKIIYLRNHYHFGQLRISWYLERYHSIKISQAGVYCVLRRHGLNRLPRNAKGSK